MNKSEFKKDQVVFSIAGNYKTGLTVKKYTVDFQARNGCYGLQGIEDKSEYVTRRPALVFATEEDAHKSLIQKLQLWIERENKRFEESRAGE